MTKSLPVIETKLVAPSLPPVHLSRPRLETAWVGKPHIRLVTVSSGAGWGKTSCLVAALKNEKRRTLWYSLDEADRDPGVFMAHLSFAYDHSLPTDQEASFLSSLINLWRAESDGTVLVLDDLQLLGQDGPVLDLIRRIIRYLPARCTLVLVSREPINLPTMKYRNQGEMVSLGARDLGFTKDEIRRLFELLISETQLSEGQLQGIASHSEGWAAGLRIFFQTLDSPTGDQLDEAVDRLGSAGAGWFTYFAEEVLAALDPQTRDFLLQTSVLPALVPALCDRILSRRDSRQVLKRLTRDNLFTFATGNSEETWRYHHLFHEFLRSRLSDQFDGKLVDDLRRRAAAALGKAGQWSEALAVLGGCQSTDPALDLIEKRADKLLATGRFAELGQALEHLGSRAVNQSAEALFLKGNVQNLHGRWEAAESTYRLALRKKPSHIRRVELQSLIAQLQMRSGRFEKCLRLCRQAMKDDQGLSTRVKARLWGLQGVCCCALGRLEQGESFLTEAVKSCRRARHRAGEGRNLFLLAANVHHIRGNFEAAEEAARRALEIFKDLQDRRLICHSLGVLGFVLVGADRITEAETCSREALRQAESLGYRNIEGYCHLTLGDCSLRTPDPDGGEYHYGKARDIARELGEASLKSLAQVGLARLALVCNKRPGARRLATAAWENSAANHDLWPQAQALMVLGQAGKSNDPYDQAEIILKKLGAEPDLLLLELWRLDELREMDPIRLGNFLNRVSAGSFEFLLTGKEPERAQRVLSSLATDHWPDPELEDLADQLLERLAPADISVGHPTAPALAIEALGPLRVSFASRVLTRKDFRSARAYRLFTLLLVNRFRWMVRDEIMESLWPDSDPRKASNNLRQTVHLLRKTLSPEGDCPFIQQLDESYSLLAASGTRYDVMEFEEALARAQSLRRQGDFSGSSQALNEAVDIYRGPFLAESPYEGFVEGERESLSLSHQRAAGQLLRQLQESEGWDEALVLCQKILPHHRGHDYFHEIMIRSHLALGQRQDALQAYRRYEKHLARDLDLLPSESMRQLAENAAGKI